MTDTKTEKTPQKCLYSFGYESKARAINGFDGIFNLPDFEARRARLLSGLDEESAATVNRILHRLKIILKLKEGDKVDLYTEEEQKAFVETNRILQSQIVKMAPDLFVWDGYALPCKHFEPNVFLDGYGFRFIETLEDIGDNAIIDAGAYIGDSALMLSPLTSGKVYAFEPMQENYGYLEKTIWLNGLGNVVPVRKALGDEEGTLTMTVGGMGACATISNKIPGSNLKEEKVSVARLDDFVRNENISVGLIKTDIEGAEQMLLRGAKETIQRDKPILLISIYHNPSDFLDIKPMIESWNLGYRFRIYHPPIKNITGETVLIAESRLPAKKRIQYKAIPKLNTANRSCLKTCANAFLAFKSDFEKLILAEVHRVRDVAPNERNASEKTLDATCDMPESAKPLEKTHEKIASTDCLAELMLELRAAKNIPVAELIIKEALATRKIDGVAELRTRLKESEKARGELFTKLQESQKARGELFTKLQESQESRGELFAKLQESQTARGELFAKLQESQKSRGELFTKLQESQTARGELFAKLQESQEARGELFAKLQESQTARGELFAKLQESQKSRGESFAKLQESQKSRGELFTKLQESQKSRGELFAKLQESQKARGDLFTKLQESQKARGDLFTKLQESQKVRGELFTKLQESQKARGELFTKLQESQKACRELRTASHAAREKTAKLEAL